MAMSEKLVIVGAGGHGKVVADVALIAGYEIVGFIDDHAKEAPLPGQKILGNLDVISALFSDNPHYKLILAIGDNATRKHIAYSLAKNDITYAIVSHPSSAISPFAVVKPGTVIMPGVVINAGAYIGKHVILNTACSVDHDCYIGDFVHISPGAHLAGNVTVGEGTHIGVGVSVIPGCKIGEWAIIGAGAVVVEDIPSRVVAVGVPAKPIRKL
ncbi:MAG: acetyltransferase [Thermanaeromonas sp.]|nr:acetyltransferase [Thermanaeromonas sp.]